MFYRKKKSIKNPEIFLTYIYIYILHNFYNYLFINQLSIFNAIVQSYYSKSNIICFSPNLEMCYSLLFYYYNTILLLFYSCSNIIIILIIFYNIFLFYLFIYLLILN